MPSLHVVWQVLGHYVVPVHHQAFRLSDEPMAEPIQRFTEALRAEPERVALRQIGEIFQLPVG